MTLTSPLNERYQELAGLVSGERAGHGSAGDIQRLCDAVESAYLELKARHAQLRMQLRCVLALPGIPVSWEMVHLRNLLRRFYPARRRVFKLAARVLAADGRMDAAADILVRVLRTRPDKDDVHDLLRSEIFAGVKAGQRARTLSETRRFRFRESFGSGFMTYPYGACADPGRGRLFVSDHSTGELHRFDLATKAHVSLRGDWGWLMGVCLDAEGDVWMCDIQARALVRVDQDGRVLDRIVMEELLGEEEQSAKPEFVNIQGDMVHVLTSDSKRDNVKAISFDRRSPRTTLRRHPALGLLGPAGIHACDGVVRYASVRPPCVFKVDPASEETSVAFSMDAVYNFQLASFGSDMILTHTDGVARIDADGEMLWDVSLADVFGEPVSVQGVAAMRKPDGDMLFLVDFHGKRVLSFDV